MESERTYGSFFPPHPPPQKIYSCIRVEHREVKNEQIRNRNE